MHVPPGSSGELLPEEAGERREGLLLLVQGPGLKQLEDAGGCEPSVGINVEDVLLQAMGHVCCHTKTYLGFAATRGAYNFSHFSSVETSI